MALMASGMNGQHFAFAGYLPIPKPERIKAIKTLEKRSLNEHQTQLFIETPYRNVQLLEELTKNCNDNTRLCIACDLTLPEQYIKTHTIKDWKNKKPDIHKRPAIFVLSAV
jgi:16S rRNA (cytidine1402-2'-O)-methyltransferase